LLQRATCCVGYVSRVTQGKLNLEEKKSRRLHFRILR